jgi:hypothetical protein
MVLGNPLFVAKQYERVLAWFVENRSNLWNWQAMDDRWIISEVDFTVKWPGYFSFYAVLEEKQRDAKLMFAAPVRQQCIKRHLLANARKRLAWQPRNAMKHPAERNFLAPIDIVFQFFTCRKQSN